MHLNEWPSAWMLGQRKQTCLNPSIPDYWEAGSLKEGRLSHGF